MPVFLDDGESARAQTRRPSWLRVWLRLTIFFFPLRWGLFISDFEVTCKVQVPACGSVLAYCFNLRLTRFPRIAVTDRDATIVRRTNDKASAAVHFVLDELRRICASVAHINELPIGRQRLGALDPQQAFTRLAFVFLGSCFRLGDLGSPMQHLVAQSDHILRFGIDRQAIVSDVSSPIPFPICPSSSSDLRVVYSNSVVSCRTRTGPSNSSHALQRCLAMRVKMASCVTSSLSISR